MDKRVEDELRTSVQIKTKNLTTSYKLIDKLGSISKGYNKEADSLFGKFRKQTSNGHSQEDDKISQLMDSISTSINNIEKSQITAFKSLQDICLSSALELQKTKGIEDNLRRQLRMVVNKLKSGGVDSVIELQTLVGQLLNIYSKIKNSDVSSQNAPRSEANTAVKVLLQGLEKLSANNIVIPQLQATIEKIYATESNREQLDLCLQAYEAIVEQFGDEFRQTQKLIININSALEEVHQVLVKSLKNSKTYDKELSKLNDQIEKQIAELSANTNEARSVKELQAIIDVKLEAITVSIKKRDAIEKKRTKELDSTLVLMESKLSKLEERTEYYRNKWLEEKTRSETDALTKLPNRGAYDKRLHEEIIRWERTPYPMALAVVDIDHFKNINDTYGHSIGDKTLQVVAKTIKKHIRASDYVARYGGEEFAVLIIGTDQDEILNPLEKVRKAIEAIPLSIKNERIKVTISIGCTHIVTGDTPHSFFDRADKALYQAKNTGRNKICYIKE